MADQQMVESTDAIPWDHGPNMRHHCLGDVSIRLTQGGAYTIVDTPNSQYTRYIGCRVSIGAGKTAHILRELMRFVDELFTSHDIPYCIYSGTLLGCMRHGDIIPWDEDIDIMILNRDVEKIASLENEINSSGFVYAEHKRYGRNYKMYVKAPENQRIVAELVSMFPYSVDHPDYGPFRVWKAHPIIQKNIWDRISSMTKKSMKLSSNALIGFDNIESIKAQVQRGDLVITNQYMDQEIFPLRRHQFAGFSVNIPNQAKTILARDYGEHSFLYATVGCGCQWVDGKYLFKVKIDLDRLNHVSVNVCPQDACGN
jgi:phosphorylcholine metabolism protein LicD